MLCRTRHHWELNTENGAISSVRLRLQNSGFTIFVTDTKGNHVYLNIEPCPCFTVTTVALYPSRRTWKGGYSATVVTVKQGHGTVTTVALYPSRRTWKGGIGHPKRALRRLRSEEHTSDFPSLTRLSYAGF